MVDGIPQKPIEGVSMAYTFDKANAKAPSTHKTQYFEMIANRGIYHDGWYANTTPPHGPWILNAPMPDADNDYKWELYNLTRTIRRPTTSPRRCPTSCKEMQALFDAGGGQVQRVAARQPHVRARDRAAAERDGRARRSSPTRARNPALPIANAPNILGQVVHDHRRGRGAAGGGDGMIVTMGGRLGGYGLYMLKGKPVFDYNMLILAQYRWEGPDALTPGKHTIVFDLHL